jgi:hypothetical protein
MIEAPSKVFVFLGVKDKFLEMRMEATHAAEEATCILMKKNERSLAKDNHKWLNNPKTHETKPQRLQYVHV